MERTNVAVRRKKPKKPKSRKPSQTQTQRQTVIVNLAEAKKVRRKKSKAKSKATAMPPAQQQQQQLVQQYQQQPPFIYATPPPDRPLLPPDRPPVANPLNPNVAVNPNQERFLALQLTPPVVKPPAKASLAEQVKIDQANAEFLANARAEEMRMVQQKIDEQRAFESANRLPMARAVSAPERLMAEAVRASPLTVSEKVLTLEERQLADRQMPPMEAQRQLSPVEEEALRRGRGRPRGSKDTKPRKPRSSSQELAEQRARASQPTSFTFGGSQFVEEPPLDRYLMGRRKDDRQQLLVNPAEDQIRFAQLKKDRVALQPRPLSLDSAVSVELEYEPAPLGLASDRPMSFM